MAEIKVPTLGESVTEATVSRWLKKPGDTVAMDEALVELETDKVTLEVNAQAAGVLGEVAVAEGATVNVGALLGTISEGGAPAAKPAAAPAAKPAAAPAPVSEKPAPAAPPAAAPAAPVSNAFGATDALASSGPAARKLVEDNKLDPATIPATGKDGRLTKGDVLAVIEAPAPAAPASIAPAAAPAPVAAPKPVQPSGPRPEAAREERVRMTRLRQRIAERLKEAQNTAAMLTTFNEVDMSQVMAMRAAYKDTFEKKHGVKLGFMSFFVKAAISALKEFPSVNAEIDGTDLVYKNYYDIGVAVSTPTGLVVPVIRDADGKGFAEIEKTIGDLGLRARDGKLAIDELQGGTFTITNGGTFGSLMSTPILNPPQSAILGMHKIQDRPIAVAGKVEIRPMMYLAVSYDHRIIDGREAVSFLVRIKDAIEDPKRLLLDL
jgi:2-oxoglutarate dehydrogenase E2 component (dihydrolipoamide succinyltransferase)